MKDKRARHSRRGAAIELCFVALITRDGAKCSQGEGGTGAGDERELGLGKYRAVIADIALIEFIGNEGGSWQFTRDGGCGGSEGEEKE